ncbi:3-deoxy-manno-octulosonate cytidylyltransferase [Helicobacter kayseriensis]|uniref:3-deoxy-manno-octulosonate cytidylyltransferase n=1 Tax=Helicobacter kayseriensis TaxID=2905877 RepID=UPI001E2F357A|nr:3-deoxy-manno-octulosonate cytidylyltransferase [Helicobacter kayseriensis]MCE3047372.1 3-deoxy-manno-octulosonate cytidylyltransferase [Helicobacter kayseriensis]MCE3048743.1 3-deoxy-manno-octulosonate cytidylyltransferase [Helicobacter kayseriensis]
MIIIPARLHSTRFPQKMLTDILGYPMIVRTAMMAKEVDDVCVATDSVEIKEVCEHYGILSVLTDSNHLSGTDRCAEAARKLGVSQDEIILNVQGDEPFLESKILQNLKEMMKTSCAFMGTCIKEIAYDQIQDPNLVKVVLDSKQQAMYFSRAPIPFDREKNTNALHYGHLGIYAFKNKHLQEFCTLPKSPLEEVEKLEQLRALWNQKIIQTLLVKTQSIGIDTLEDKQRAIEIFG